MKILKRVHKIVLTVATDKVCTQKVAAKMVREIVAGKQHTRNRQSDPNEIIIRHVGR